MSLPIPIPIDLSLFHSMEAPIITVRGLSKKYYIGKGSNSKGKHGLLDTLLMPYRMLKGITLPFSSDKEKSIWALKDVNFDVYNGERIGIIGRNGAGKTTLLKILSRLVYPTEGKAVIRGRVTSLFGVGTGFNANLTGRENIYFNASILGLTKSEIKEKFAEIVDFSGIGKFIDTPVKYYSSGMHARLAFSVAAHLDPDILFLDEVLVVGDMAFQKKCLKKVEGMTGEGNTLLFVSHSIGDVLKFCDKVIWLEEGYVKFFGNVVEGVELYQTAMSTSDGEVSVEHRTEKKGTGYAQVSKIGIYDKDMQPINAAIAGHDLIVMLHYKCDLARLFDDQDIITCTLYVENERAQRLFGMPNYILKSYKPVHASREGKIIYTIKRLPLLPGHYNLSYTLSVGNEKADKLFQSRGLVILDGDFYNSGHLPHQNMGSICVDFDWKHEHVKT